MLCFFWQCRCFNILLFYFNPCSLSYALMCFLLTFVYCIYFFFRIVRICIFIFITILELILSFFWIRLVRNIFFFSHLVEYNTFIIFVFIHSSIYRSYIYLTITDFYRNALLLMFVVLWLHKFLKNCVQWVQHIKNELFLIYMFVLI